MSMLPYGPSMIKQRKWMHSAFGEESALKKLDVLRQRETCVLLTGLMATPADFVLHVKRYLPVSSSARAAVSEAPSHESFYPRHIAAIIVEAVYGHRITSLDDEYVTLMFRAMEATTATGAAGATPADILPIRKFQHRPSN